MPAEAAIERLRPARSGDDASLTALFRDVFGSERSTAWWRWKYEAHPVGSVSIVCEARGTIVGHCGGTMIRFRVGGEEVPAIQLVDVMTSSAWSSGSGGGSVFAKTTLAFFRASHEAGIRLLYGFPGERHRLAGERLLGYRTVGPVGDLVLDPAGDDGSAMPLEEDDLADFALGDRSGTGAVRDQAWLRWRYLAHPEHRYSRVAAGDASAIVRATEEAAWLMELGGASDESSLRALTNALRRLGRPVRFWCSPSHRIAEALKRCGFQMTIRDHSVASAWFRASCDWSRRAIFRDDALDPSEMYYTLGDYDVY